MQSEFQKVSRRVWALVLSTLMVLTTVMGSVTISSKTAKAADSVITDGNFASLASAETSTGWWIYDAQNDGNWANCAANITAEGAGLQLQYTANNGGFYDAIWGIQVPQWINVEAGVNYTLSFDVTATGVKGIKAKVDGKEIILDRDFTTTAGTQTFTAENVVFDATETVKFLFALGWMEGDDSAVDVTISNVQLTPAPVPVNSTLLDGNFANLQTAEATEGWWIYDAQNDGNWANCAAGITADGTGLTLDYTGNNGGFYDAIWGIQVPQWISVTAGTNYTLSFDVASTGVKGIKAKVDGKESVLDSNFTAQPGNQTFTVENIVFDATETVKFLFALGWMEGDDSAVNVKISNVTLVGEEGPAPVAAVPFAINANRDTVTLQVNGMDSASAPTALLRVYGSEAEATADTDTSAFTGYEMAQNADGNWESVVTLPEAVQGGQCVKYFFVTYDAEHAGHNSEFGYYTYNAPSAAPEKTVAEMEAAGYTLVWSDEFNGDTLDRSKWDYQIGNGLTASNNAGWGNQEAEYYTDSTDNVYVQDGNLHITALKQDTTDPAEGTFHYTSGRLRTTSDVAGQLFATKYGRVEARMILPTEEGAWPAFWMLPQDQFIYNGWAASGEIDIMEAYGDKPKLFAGTIHFGSQWPNNIYKGKSYTFDDTTDVGVYHTYGIEWEPGKITWFVDDVEYYTADTWYSITAGTAENNTFDAPFDVPFYILLNVAVDGTWDAGEADNGDYTGNGRSSMLVDYVRVYGKNGVDYDNPNPPAAAGSAGDSSGYDLYVAPLCGAEYHGFNFVQDPNFDTLKTAEAVDPNDTDWQFYVGDFGGAATWTKEDGTVTVDITSAGNQAYAIQLIKHMPFLNGYNYKVTFDAYADAERNITIHPSGDADNGWAGYASETVTIGTESKTYSFSFTMGNDTDPTARLEFNLGSAGTANVHISNVKVEMVDQIEIDDNVEKTPLPDGNLIWNGTFDEGTQRLSYWSVEGNVVVPNFVDYQIAERDHVVRNDRTGVNENYTRRAIVSAESVVDQGGLTLKQSDQYRLVFKAYTQAPDSLLSVGVYGAEAEDVVLYAVRGYELTPGSENTYELVFAMPYGVTDTDAHVRLYNCNDTEIQLDDVALYPITHNNAEQMDFSTVEPNPVPESSDAFMTNYHTAGNDPAVAEDGVYTIQTWNDTNNYQSMFLHPVDLTAEIAYVLTFDGKSDVENTYEVAIQQDNTWAMAMDTTTFTTTPEWQTYTMPFTSALTTAGGDTTFLKYLLSSCENESNLYLRNITLRAVLPEIEPSSATAPEDTAVLVKETVKSGEDIVIRLADNAWTEKFLALKDGYGAVVMVECMPFDYTVLPAMINGNLLTIPGDDLGYGEYRIELALDRYNNIVLNQEILAPEEPTQQVDKSQLQETVDSTGNIKAADYTKASYDAYAEAYAHAAAVLADPDATQAEVDAANAALQAAIDGLKHKAQLNPEEGGETGDPSFYLYLLLMAAAVMGGSLAVYDKKKRI